MSGRLGTIRIFRNTQRDTPQVAILMAAIVGAIGAVSLVTGIFRVSSVQPLHIPGAVCGFFLASAILAYAFGRNTLAKVLTIVPFVLAIVSLVAWSLNLPLAIDEILAHLGNNSTRVEGRVSIVGSILCIGTGLSINLLSLRKQSRRATFFTGTLSTFLAVCSFVALIAELIGINLTPGFPIANQIVPFAALCFSLLNIGLAMIAYRRCQLQDWRLNWLSYPAALGVLVGTAVLCSAQIETEADRVSSESREKANHIREQIESRLVSDAAAIARMASRMRSGMEVDRSLWSQDAEAYLHDNPEFKAIEWIDPSLHIRWVEPVQGNEKVFKFDLSKDPRRKAAVDAAIRDKSVSVSRAISLLQGGTGFLIYAPIFKGDELKGLIAVPCRLDRLMGTIPKKVYKGYAFQLAEERGGIFATDLRTDFHSGQSSSYIDKWNLRWLVKTTPIVKLNPFSSKLVLVILLVGCLVAVLTWFSLVSLERMSFLARNEERARRFLEGLSDSSITPTYVFDLARRRIVHTNRIGYESLGLSEREVLDGGLPLLKKLVHPDDWAITLAQFSDVKKLADSEIYEFEHRIRSRDGEWHWLAYRECVLERRPNGEPQKILMTSQDITQQKESAAQLAKSKEDLEQVLENAPIGMALVSPEGKWMYVNPALCKIIGYAREELLVTDFQAMTHPDDLEADLGLVLQMLEGKIQTYSIEKRYYQKTGQLVWVNLCVSLIRFANGEPAHFVSQIQDISDRKLGELLNKEFTESLVQHTDFLAETNQRLEHESRTDALTGIANRRYFVEELTQSVQYSQRYNRPLSAIMLDVDHFKKFNDEFGHAAGDVVLQHVGVVLREICRESNLPARYGGEEFIILCPESNAETAAELAERLRQKISEIDLPYRQVTASFGVAEISNDAGSLLERADAALYRAKAAGRNQVSIDQPDISSVDAA